MHLTPSTIEVLIHCYVSPVPHPRITAPAVVEGLEELHMLGLIEPSKVEGAYVTTARGVAHIEQVCRLTLPIQAWIGADGEVICRTTTKTEALPASTGACRYAK